MRKKATFLGDELAVVKRTRIWSRSGPSDVVRAFRARHPDVSIKALEWLTNESGEAVNYAVDSSTQGLFR